MGSFSQKLATFVAVIFYAGDVQAECSANSAFRMISRGCPTSMEFCRSILQGQPEATTIYIQTPVPVYTKTVVNTAHTPVKTIFSVTSTVTITKRHLQSTIGQKTTTQNRCAYTTTCGAAALVGQDSMSAACTCFVQRSVTKRTTLFYKTKTIIYPNKLRVTRKVADTTTVYPVHTTTVPTVTVNKCATLSPPVQTCSNAGDQFAVYQLTDTDYKNRLHPWDIDYYKTIAPLRNGSGVSVIESSTADYYATEDQCQRHWINQQTYLYAPQNGTYIFHIPYVQYLGYVWVGDLAYSGYNQSNAFLKPGDGHPTYGYSRPIQLEAGKYYPLRFAFACLGPGYAYYFNLRRPDGFIMIGAYGPYGLYPDYLDYNQYGRPYERYTDYFVQFGCGVDENLAPKFLDWGHET